MPPSHDGGGIMKRSEATRLKKFLESDATLHKRGNDMKMAFAKRGINHFDCFA